MRAKIEAAEHIALIAHLHPDADSLGAACAMYAHLLRLQKRVTLFCASETIDGRLAFLPWAEKLTHRWNDRADLAIAFDCGSYARLGVEPLCFLINVDHHSGNEHYGDLQVIDTDAVSTTMVLMQWFKRDGYKINAKMATALYAGLADDTVAFMSRRVDADVFEAAAELARCGAEVSRVHQALFTTQPLSALRLKALIFGSLELKSDARIVVLKVTRAMFAQSGGEPSACEDALHEALGLPTVSVAVLLRERKDGSIKVSLRCDAQIDMAKIAKRFGGGGHVFASGFVVLDGGIDATAEKVLDMIEKEFE